MLILFKTSNKKFKRFDSKPVYTNFNKMVIFDFKYIKVLTKYFKTCLIRFRDIDIL